MEGTPEFRGFLAQLLGAMDSGNLLAVTSELTLLETLAKPLAENRGDLVLKYLEWIQPARGLDVIAVSRSILVKAATFRAKTRMKTPDAIHLATADSANCAAFLTNDKSIKGLEDSNIILLSEAVGL
ncbi:MAG: PIN domain-containing protein [Candidatus Sumerlaeaceae bacterium]|nr:PIN domain-containing protein [Candidatus Sumerlaeaceae bacterium]